MKLRSLPLSLLAVAAMTASAQSPLPAQTDRNHPITPFRTIKITKSILIDPSKFSPRIGANFPAPRQMPENPLMPVWSQIPNEPNSLPLGGMTDALIGKAGPHFPGLSATGWFPADPTIAVGPNNIVETVNATLAFYTKSGTQQSSQAAQTFFAGLGATSFQFDPRVIYDRIAQRWVILYDEEDDTTQTSKILIAVSTTNDPNGTWHAYRVEAKLTVGSSSYWLDYPSIGYNNDGYVITGNMFGFTSGYGGIQFIVLPKAPMLTGAAVTASYLRDTSGLGTAQMADTFDPTATAAVYGVTAATTSSLRIYAITNVATSPVLNFTSLSVPPFAAPTTAAPSTPGTLDTLDLRFFSSTWRNDHMFASDNVSVSGATQVRWYDILLHGYPFGAPTLAQSGNLAGTSPAQFHMGAVGQNGYFDTSAIFTRSSTSIPADAMFAARHNGDSAGTMGAANLLESSAGTAYGGSGTNRWGDYFRCVVDPADDATFWGVAMTGTATGDWRADIYSWTVTTPASLTSTSLPANVLSTQTASGQVTLTGNAPQYGYTVGLSSSNPSVASVPASVTVPNGASSIGYTLTAGSVTSDTTVTITASLRGVNRTANITVLAPRLTGTVTLGDFVGTVAGQPVTIQVRNPGSTTALDTYSTTLDSSGHFSVITTRSGTYDVAIKGSHWLRKVVANVTFNGAGASGVNATLLNGDINGDNAVTLGDFAALRAAYGSSSGDSNWNPMADLNGDGAVTLGDFAILRAHYGLNGDN